MNAKNKTQAGRRDKETREQLKARALETIDDVRGFDADARRSVYVALQNLKLHEAENGTESEKAEAQARELADVLDKAGKGIPPFDRSRFGEHYTAACLVWSILEGGENELPEFLVGALMVALGEAARLQDMDVLLDVDDSGDMSRGGYSVQAIASLFWRAPTLSVDLEPKRDLAGLISAVLTHDDVPGIVYNKLTDALVEMHDSTDVYNDPRAVRALLDYQNAKPEEAAEKGGA